MAWEINDPLTEYLISTAEARPEVPSLSQVEQASEGGHTLGLLGQIAGPIATFMGTKMLSNLLPPQYRLPALAVSALAGGTWGGIKSFLENKPWYDYPKNIGEEALYFTAPLPTMAVDIAQEGFKTAIGRKTPEEFASEIPGFALGTGLGLLGLKATDRSMLDPMLFQGIRKAAVESRGEGIRSLIKKAGENTWENLAPERAQIYNYPIPQVFERKLGASTFGELFTAPQERVNPEVGKRLWRQDVANREMRRTIEQIGESARTLSPDELKFSLDYLKSGMTQGKEFWKDVPEEIAEKVFNIFGPMKNFPQNVKGAFNEDEQIYLVNKVAKRIGKLFEKEPVGDKFLADIKVELDKAGDYDNVQKGLMKIIKNPAISDETKSYAVAMHDLPITSVEKLGQAWRNTTVDLLKKQIYEVPGTVVDARDIAKVSKDISKNYVRIDKSYGPNWAEFKGKYLERNAYHAFLDLLDTKSYAENFLNKYYTQPWKLVKAVARFPAAFRNLFGNFWLNSTTHNNPLPISEVGLYDSVLRDMGVAAPTKLGWIKVPGATRGEMASDLKAFFRDAGLHPGVFTEAELPPWRKAMKANRSMVDAILDYFNYAMSPATDFYTFAETWAKAAKYRWNRKAGMDHWDAMTDAVRTTFHYGEVSRATRMARETILPFATFQSKVMPSVIENIVRNPLGVLKWYFIPWMISQGALKQLDITEPEWEEIRKNMPNYMKNGMYMMLPFRDEKNRLQMFNMTWWLPGLGDLSETINSSGEPGRWMQNPAFNLGADIFRNVKGGTDIPIWNEWDSPVLKLGKAFGHIYQSIMPTWMPGFGRDSFPLLPAGPDFRSVLEAIEGRPEAATPTQALSSQLGLKVQPLDESLLAQKKGRRLRRLKGEVEASMRREIRNAISEDEKNSIIQKYTEYLQNLERL